MIRIDKFSYTVEEEYYKYWKNSINKRLEESSLDPELITWITENLSSMLVGYKNIERVFLSEKLITLEEINKEFVSLFGNLLNNSKIYEINNYFNKYTTTDKKSKFYNQKIDIEKAKKFLESFEDCYFDYEKNIFLKFLSKCEAGNYVAKQQKSELEEVLIHKVLKDEINCNKKEYDKYGKRIKNIDEYQGIIDNFIDNNKKYRLDYILKDKNLEEFERIFNYTKFGKNKDYGRHKIMSSLNIEVCPYCNRNYITNYTTNYTDDSTIKTTADLDHYYPQAKYPYLALSLYNFIPSCQICNSRMKGNKEGHLYPYEDEFGENAKFTTGASQVEAVLNSNENKLEIKIKLKSSKDFNLDERIEKSIKIFKLSEVYKTSHNKYILNMLHNIEYYPEEYLGSIEELFDENPLTEENNKTLKEKYRKEIKELEKIIKQPYQDRIDRGDTLSKLTQDILREFDF